MYHAFGRAVMHYINATMTLERDQVELGIESLKVVLDLTSKTRRQKGLMEGVADWFRTPNYDDYSDGE